MPTRVLVTGATGYVGGRLVPELLDAGVAVLPGPSPSSSATGRGPMRSRSSGRRHRRRLLPRPGRRGATYSCTGWARPTTSAKAIAWRRRRLRDAPPGRCGAADLPGRAGARRHRLVRAPAQPPRVSATLAPGRSPSPKLRAAVVIGSGSASEMLRLTDVLPVAITPRWVRTRCQPIAIRDVLAYLSRGARRSGGARPGDRRPGCRHVRGNDGPVRRRCRCADAVVPVPVLTLLVVVLGRAGDPLPAGWLAADRQPGERGRGARPPSSRWPRACLPLRDAIEAACSAPRDLEVTTSWADAGLAGRSPADPMPADPDWSAASCSTTAAGGHHGADRAGLPPSTVLGGAGLAIAEPFWDIGGSPTGSPAGPVCGADGAILTTCGSATPSTSSGSRPSSQPTGAAASEMRVPGRRGWSGRWSRPPTEPSCATLASGRRCGGGRSVCPPAVPPCDLPAPGRAPGRHRRAAAPPPRERNASGPAGAPFRCLPMSRSQPGRM